MANQCTSVVAAFDDRLEAERAVDDLEKAGFRTEDVGYVIRGSQAAEGGMITDAEGTKDGRGAVAGMATGAGIGAILGAAAAMLIPGVGPVVAAGVLTTALGGAIAGTAVGGIFGAMTGLGVSEDEAKFYEQEFQAGKAIVAVQAGTRVNDAREIMRRHGGYDMQIRSQGEIPTHGVFARP